jgi:hypothetical protein
MKIFRVALSLAALAALAQAQRPVFPGAVGFGIDTPAGRGGRILHVTNLESAGPGSLREAIETKGPRIVIFEVGGVIDLGMKDLEITEPFLTIAGQTAPSPGITMIRGGIRMTTHDILMQHIRVRPGDAGQPKKSGWMPEVTTWGPECYNIVVDHCSMSWAVDENLSASGPPHNGPKGTTHNLTFSNNIIAEGLFDATHTKGKHSMGTLVHDNSTNIAIIGNLYAHNNARNPYFKAYTTGVIANNLIYNPGHLGITVDWVPSEWANLPTPANARVGVVGNVMYHGVNTTPTLALVCRKGDVYLEDNLAYDASGKPAPMTSGSIKILPAKPVWPANFKPLKADQVVGYVTRHAGARPRERDDVDSRIIRQFEERKGRIIDSQDEVGGYPKAVPTRRKLDVPATGVEAWLARLAAALE